MKLGEKLKGWYKKGVEIKKKYQEQQLENNKRKLANMKVKSQIAQQRATIAKYESQKYQAQKQGWGSGMLGGGSSMPARQNNDIWGGPRGGGGINAVIGPGGGGGGINAVLGLNKPKIKHKRKKGGGKSITINLG